MNLFNYGWNVFFDRQWVGLCAENREPARVIGDFGLRYKIICEAGEFSAEKDAKFNEQLAVGDWVIIEHIAGVELPLIKFLLNRKTKFSRAAAGPETKEQLIAANVDYVFLIQSLNKDFNLRRLERYLIAAWESGAMPVVVLTKSDCCEDAPSKLALAAEIALGVDIHTVSALTGDGMEGLLKYVLPGTTIALLGSSGVGKSTLVNSMAGKDIFKTQAIREDDSKGRHTTTHREIVLLPQGGLILDTPGMRALSLWEAETGMNEVFGDIEEIVSTCRYNDCRHRNEPGCAVREALQSGQISEKRWGNWQKLQRELAHLDAKKAGKQRMAERAYGKQLSKFQRQFRKGV